MAVFIGLIGFLGLVSGMGLGTGFIRLTGNAIKARQHDDIAGNYTAVWLLFWVFTTPVAIGLLVWRDLLATRILGGVATGWEVGFLAPAFMFSVASGLQVSLMSAFGKIAGVAKATALMSVIGTASAVSCVYIWRESGLAVAVLAQTTSSWLISTAITRSALSLESTVGTLSNIHIRAKALLAFGFPYMLSMIAGQGVQMLMPLLLVAILDEAAVGFFRVAATLSTAYLSVVMIGLRNDFLPRLSALKHDCTSATRATEQQFVITISLSASLSILLIVLAPQLVPLVYSDEFAPAVSIVVWYVLGDILRVAALIVSYFVLVKSGSIWFLVIEAVLGVALITAVYAGVSVFGVPGIGIAHVGAYGLHFAVAVILAAAVSGFRPGPYVLRTLAIFTAIGATAVFVLGFPPSSVRHLLLMSIVVLAGLIAAFSIRGWMGTHDAVSRVEE